MLLCVLLKQIFHLILPSYFSECPPSNKQGPSGEEPVALTGEGLGGGKAEWSVLGAAALCDGLCSLAEPPEVGGRRVPLG